MKIEFNSSGTDYLEIKKVSDKILISIGSRTQGLSSIVTSAEISIEDFEKIVKDLKD